MNDLSNRIYEYYLRHFDELPFDNRFHFASRLYLWSRDPAAGDSISQLRREFTWDNPRQAVRSVIDLAQASATHGSKNAAELRRPYFERYPKLKTYVTALFRLSFMQTVYQIDTRQLFYEFFPAEEVEAFARQLRDDSQALAILSTHAVNFLYLYERFVKQDERSLDPRLFLDLERRYDLADRLQTQLLIYLYTHCVIGESLFYYRHLPEQSLPVYRQMLESLQSVIDERFDAINLDNKFEFLVTAQLVGLRSPLEQRIWDEASRSLADDGVYLIDRHNTNPQTANVTLDKSEHRNVLAIMAAREFKPSA